MGCIPGVEDNPRIEMRSFRQAIRCIAASVIVLTAARAHAASIDVALVLDESGSISSLDFFREKSFAASLASSFAYGPTGAAVAVETFGTTARTILDLSQVQALVVNSINAIAQQGGSTCMPCAFDSTVSQFATHGRGAGTPQVTVFVTDGTNNVRTSDFDSSLAALQAAGPVFAVGVGSAVSATEIDQIASDIPGIQTSFFAADFVALAGLLDPLKSNLQELTGQPPPPPSPPPSPPPPPPGPAPLYVGPFDIMILMDHSGSVDGAEWAQEQNFVLQFVNSRLIGPSADLAGIGKFATDADLELALSGNKTMILNAVNAAAREGGQTCISCALDLAADEFAAHGRPGADKITLLLTDGLNNVRDEDLATAIAELQAISTVVAVGIGGSFLTPQLDAIASDIDGLQTVYSVPTFAQLAGVVDGLTSSLGARARTTAVPEPSTLLGFLPGLLLVLLFLTRRRSAGAA